MVKKNDLNGIEENYILYKNMDENIEINVIVSKSDPL